MIAIFSFLAGVWLSVGAFTALIVDEGDESVLELPKRVGLIIMGPVALLRVYLDIWEWSDET